MVVGAGLMGASAAWHLARRGHAVTLLERFELNHQRGSSHGAARIFRLVYDIPDYVHLAQRALPLWREAERELRSELLWTTGGLDLGPAQHLELIERTLSEADVPYERLSPGMVARRFPAFAVDSDWEGIFQPHGGVLNADACRLGLTELARRAGADVRPRTPVTALRPENGSVWVETGEGRWLADQAVLCAAGWSNQLLKPLGLAIPMTVTREHVAYYPQRGDAQMPPFIFHQRITGSEFYGLPNWRGHQVKCGINLSGPETDPDVEGRVEPSRIETISRMVREHVPGADPEPSRSETCLYASTPDDDFVMDRAGPIVLGIGFGGHGFKFGAVIGELLAELVEETSGIGTSRFAHRRFGRAVVP